MQLGPDEQIYLLQAQAIRDLGIRSGFRELSRAYLDDPELAAYPSPIRWVWILALRYVPRLTLVSGILLAPLAVCSPLLWILARRRLQDTWIALLTVAAGVAAWFGCWPALTVLLFVLAASKESAWLALPAIATLWLTRGHPLAPLCWSFGISIAAYCLATAAILGRSAPSVLNRALSGHDTDYTREHQRGAWHRLLVDLAMLSPVPLLLAASSAQHHGGLALGIGLLVATHAVAPVRNVRLILAADIGLRILAALALLSMQPAAAIGFATLALVADITIARNVSKIYDPVTAQLCAALGMPDR